jgi:hypothetical protein
MRSELVVLAADHPAPDQTIEYVFWFKLDGTVPLKAVSALILAHLEAAQIPGVVNGEFHSPFAKEYDQ